MTQQEDLIINRLELFYNRDANRLLREVTSDIALTSPATTVRGHRLDVEDAWDFERMYGALFEFAERYPFDTDREDYLVHITTGSHVAQICLFLLTESRRLPARLLQTTPSSHGRKRAAPGERERRRSAEGSYTIIDLDVSRYDALAKRFQRERERAISSLKAGIATRNARFNALVEEMEHVAVRSRAPMLLLGETGVGKSQLGKRIYGLKKARHLVEGEFVEVNCATLRGDMAMSTLFGHKKGAFTGALGDRDGVLRRAHQGLLFLDEIGELGMDEQAMLLRALEEGVFTPLGSDKNVSSAFQLVCGTNRDLGARVAEHKFRADLLARINMWTFELPRLAERPEDLEPNLEFELDRLSQQEQTRFTMSREARDTFLAFARAHTWPGNFRDFSASVLRLCTFAEGGRITRADVDREVARVAQHTAPPSDTPGYTRAATLLGDLSRYDLFDLTQLEEVLRVCAQAKSGSDAGRVLFAASRRARSSVNDSDRIKKYLARFGLDFAQVRHVLGER
jgi:transcriptional regulatory protein RtcR